MRRLSEIFAAMSQPTIDDLREYVAEKVASVNGIDRMKGSLNPVKLAIEFHATRKAHEKLSEILREMDSISGRGVEPKDPRDSYDPKFYGKR